MKSVMYHYVQNNNPNYKFFNFLSLRNSEKQIKYFKKKFKIEDAKKLFEIKKLNKNSVFLTFDDGLKCHYDYVFPVLKKHGVNGIFYIPALSYKKKKYIGCTQNTFNIRKIWPNKSQ